MVVLIKDSLHLTLLEHIAGLTTTQGLQMGSRLHGLEPRVELRGTERTGTDRVQLVQMFLSVKHQAESALASPRFLGSVLWLLQPLSHANHGFSKAARWLQENCSFLSGCKSPLCRDGGQSHAAQSSYRGRWEASLSSCHLLCRSDAQTLR